MGASRIKFLDGIRGWGALAVLLYHVFIDGFPVTRSSHDALYKVFIFNGPLGVWIFFVVSGFALSIGFFQNRDTAQLRRMFAGRYFRLAVPILLASLLVYFSWSLGLIQEPAHRPDRFQDNLLQVPTLWEVLRYSAYDVFFNYTPQTSLIPPLWTMAYELYGSLIVLALLVLTYRTERKGILYPVYFIALYIAFKLEKYYASFIIGMIFALLYVHKPAWLEKMPRAILILLMPLAIYSSMNLPDNNDKHYFYCSLLMAFLCIFYRPLRSFLSSRVSEFLGKISFPLYLTHSTLFYCVTMNVYKHYLVETPAMVLAGNLVTVVIALALARAFSFADTWGILASKKVGLLFAPRKKSRHAGELIKMEGVKE